MWRMPSSPLKAILEIGIGESQASTCADEDIFVSPWRLLPVLVVSLADGKLVLRYR